MPPFIVTVPKKQHREFKNFKVEDVQEVRVPGLKVLVGAQGMRRFKVRVKPGLGKSIIYKVSVGRVK